MASPDALLGAGLYETVRVSAGTALHGERHLQRMRASALALGLPPPGREAFARALAEAAGAGEVVRAILTAPEGAPELSAQGRAPGLSDPVRLMALGGWYAPGYLLREHKLTSHFHGVQGRRLAQDAGFDDALLVAHDGRVGEATNANVAFLAGTVLVTPSVDGLLPGVCRTALLEAARGLGLRVESRVVALAELVDADGALVTSSPRGLIEVAELDGHALRRMPADLLGALREGVAATAQAHALALP